MEILIFKVPKITVSIAKKDKVVKSTAKLTEKARADKENRRVLTIREIVPTDGPILANG